MNYFENGFKWTLYKSSWYKIDAIVKIWAFRSKESNIDALPVLAEFGVFWFSITEIHLKCLCWLNFVSFGAQ